MREVFWQQQLERHYKKCKVPVVREVYVPPRTIDLVVLLPNTHRLMAIEVKLSDWRKVIDQSLRNLEVAHFSVVAMPIPQAERVVEAGIQEIGVLGLTWLPEGRSLSLEWLRKPLYNIGASRLAKRLMYRRFAETYSRGTLLV